jgi:hypothetical protein
MRFTDENAVGGIAVNFGSDWTEYRAWWHDGKYWSYETSGCSCNSFNPGDHEPQPVGNIHFLFADARDFVNRYKSRSLDIDDYVGFVSQVEKARTKGLG